MYNLRPLSPEKGTGNKSHSSVDEKTDDILQKPQYPGPAEISDDTINLQFPYGSFH
ncbi:hypothetical protein JCM12294_10520 [Desulfocicer niacini]